MAKRHDEGYENSFESSVIILADRFPDENIRSLCLMERMRCLTEVMKDDRMRGWSMDVD
jgi:hypothetical protein